MEISPLIATPMYLVLAGQSRSLRITHLFDDVAEEVATWDEAVRFVAGPKDDGTWLSGLCAEFKVADVH